jgi:hypothetical protein
MRQRLSAEGLRLLGHPEPDKQVRVDYVIYRRLCWCKHGSPLTSAGITATFVLHEAERLAALLADPISMLSVAG